MYLTSLFLCAKSAAARANYSVSKSYRQQYKNGFYITFILKVYTPKTCKLLHTEMALNNNLFKTLNLVSYKSLLHFHINIAQGQFVMFRLPTQI
jgi:hypothetical protein